jgi:hypothetical protein
MNPRETVAAALMSTATDENESDGHMLLGFVTIAEWLAPDGRRFLGIVSGTDSGELPEWTIQGYLAGAQGSLADWATADEDE